MPVTTDILRSYRAPRAVLRSHMAAGQREDRALAFLMGACVVMFIGQWPRLQREAMMNPEGPPLDALLGTALQGWLLMMPLLLYGLAALSRIVMGVIGGRGSWYSARLALFWTLLVVSPLVLFQGLVYGFVDPGPGRRLADAVLSVAFFLHWGAALRETEFARTDVRDG